MDLTINESCASMHIARWLAMPSWLTERVNQYRAGKLAARGGTPEQVSRSYLNVDAAGIAHVSMSGALMKAESKFGDTTSTVSLRQAVRKARADPAVKGMLIQADSPGGTVAGTDELAADLRAFAAVKPLHVHAEGMLASAAYWAAVQGHRITATRLTDVGSIGVMAVITDTSGMAEREGIKVHVVKAGEHKGAFVPGVEVTDEQIDAVQGDIDAIFAAFQSEVRKGRGMTAKQVGEVATGRTWLADDALRLGLIDAIADIDAAYNDVIRAVSAREREAKRRRTQAAIMRPDWS